MTAAPYSILVVEDSVDIAFGLRDLLEHEGYQPIIVGTRQAALTQIRERRFNAILLDLGLPDGDGCDILREMQQLDATVPVVVLTAHISADHTVGSLIKGAFAYLTKPYNSEELRHVLRRAIGVKELALKVERTTHLLSESEDRFRSLVESASDAIIVGDGRGTIVSWNRAASKLFGYSEQEILGHPLTILMPPRFHQAHLDGLARMEATGKGRLIGTVVELQGLRKDGTEFPIELSLATWKTAQGNFYSGIIRDTSERTRAEQAVKQLQRQRDLILTQAGEGIYGLDREGRTTFVNPSAAGMLGYPAEELIGRDMHQVLHHSKPDGVPYSVEDCPIHAAINDGTIHRVRDDVFWRKDGSGFPVEYTATPIREGSDVIGAVIVFRDMTEKKEAERAVEESQMRFRQLAEHIREVFWITEPAKNQMLYISPGYEELWMRSCASLYASPRSWMEAIHPEDRDRVCEAALTKQITGGYDEQYRIIRPDGSLRWIWDRAFPIADETGAVYRIVGLAEDITDRKAVEEALSESEGKYRALFEFKDHILRSTADSVKVLDLEGRIQFMNEAAQALMEFRAVAPLLNTQWTDLWQGEDRAAAVRALAAAKAGEIGTFIGFRSTATGNPRWWDVRITPMVDARNVPVRLLVISRDITKYRRAQEALQASEERLELVIRGSHDGFWDSRILPDEHWSSPRTPVWWSQRVKDMLGYTDEEFPDVLESWTSRLHAEDHDRVFAALTAHIERRVPYDVQYRLLTKQGKYRWFRARGQALWDAEGRITRMGGSLQSLDERMHMEETGRRSNAAVDLER